MILLLRILKANLMKVLIMCYLDVLNSEYHLKISKFLKVPKGTLFYRMLYEKDGDINGRISCTKNLKVFIFERRDCSIMLFTRETVQTT